MSQSLTEQLTTHTISCNICSAIYTPSDAHTRLMQAPVSVLESAYMSICHFCFRCHRAACPECWDDVHGICGVCVQDTHLPFRAEAPALEGTVFPVLHYAQPSSQRSTSPMLVCIQHGSFHTEASSPSTDPVQTAGDDVGAQFIAPRSTPMQTSDSTNRLTKVLRVAERVATRIALGLLLTIVVLIVLAEISPAMNTLIMHVLSVDIRSETAYPGQLIQQLRW